MAFDLSIARKDGVTATYHAIRFIVIDYENDLTTVVLLSYLSKAIAETAGDVALAGADEFSFRGNPGLADARDWAYAQIIQQQKWAGATPIPDTAAASAEVASPGDVNAKP